MLIKKTKLILCAMFYVLSVNIHSMNLEVHSPQLEGPLTVRVERVSPVSEAGPHYIHFQGCDLADQIRKRVVTGNVLYARALHILGLNGNNFYILADKVNKTGNDRKTITIYDSEINTCSYWKFDIEELQPNNPEYVEFSIHFGSSPVQMHEG